MVAIVAYGSLIDPALIDPVQCARSYPLARAYPVVVSGYRRTFNQEPSWRKGDNQHRAVLNVMHSDGECFNGVLIELPKGTDFCQLDKRERGYNRIPIDPSRITYLADGSCLAYAGSLEQIYLYVGKPSKRNNNILPNKDYLNLCLRGARRWGEDFYARFLQTTYVGESTLNTFLLD